MDIWVFGLLVFDLGEILVVFSIWLSDVSRELVFFFFLFFLHVF
jgi:hypothetical protein